ncbi:hypothetical protein [Prevotella sp. KH2C16]|uniref:hypothetical protein n=1 Tax=Prevotella sp. KH2C16 TaxID=1855325 RepID=UPI000B86F50B|nr:hypothetical protein [Prevotella sp. KH2C16]
MRKIILLIVTGLLICSCNAKSDLKDTGTIPIDTLIGNWMYYQYHGKQSHANCVFDLTLKKAGKDSVIGNYCSIWDNGNRIDCSSENANNIKGVFRKDTLYLSFHGFYDEHAQGEAKVYKQKGGDVIWEMGKEEGAFYLPHKVVLLRDDTAKYFSDVRRIDSLEKLSVAVESEKRIDVAEIPLPFDFHHFQHEQDLYDEGKHDDMPYKCVYIEDNKELEYTYKSQWDNSKPGLLYRIHTGKEYKLDMVSYAIDGIPSLIYRLITSIHGVVIDGLTVFSFVGEDEKDWNTSSFTISKDLGITIYKNKLHHDKIVKQTIVGRYAIDDEGRFVKQDFANRCGLKSEELYETY